MNETQIRMICIQSDVNFHNENKLMNKQCLKLEEEFSDILLLYTLKTYGRRDACYLAASIHSAFTMMKMNAESVESCMRALHGVWHIFHDLYLAFSNYRAQISNTIALLR